MKNELLHKFVNTLKDNNFEVYTSAKTEDYSYCFFVKDNKIGYVQTAYFGGLTFSTVHHGCRSCGTGFGLNDDGICNPTIEDAENAFMIAPYWASQYIKDVKKYKSWEDYTSKPINQILKYIKL